MMALRMSTIRHGRFLETFIFAVITLAALLAGCVTQTSMSTRTQLISTLENEMLTNTSWLRIHAAEGLLDNGQSEKIADLFRPEAESAPAPYRIGVWRVIARATVDTERREYVGRIRGAMRDPNALDRVSAAESLGKLDAASRDDREHIIEWLTTADDATAAFPRWVMVLSSNPAERETDEAALAKLLESPDPIARLRTAFALGRLKTISSQSLARLGQRLANEPADSIAKVYMITAVMLQAKDPATIADCEQQLIPYAKNGKANEQLEVGIATGLRGKKEGIAILQPLLENPEPDARIGAANGLLKLLR